MAARGRGQFSFSELKLIRQKRLLADALQKYGLQGAWLIAETNTKKVSSLKPLLRVQNNLVEMITECPATKMLKQI